jgi:hypothetical protein
MSSFCSTGNVHCNAYHSKSKVHISSFLRGWIATNDGRIILIVEGKWFKVIIHLIEFEILNLAHPK